MLYLERNHAELNEISFKRLEEAGLGISAGRIAKLLLSIVNENVAEFYSTLKEQHVQAFLSYATGQSLDLIGELLNCPRESGEEDDDYRYRISKQTLSLARANETAVRLAVLSVEGVEDVVMRPFTHGTGSFSVYVVTNAPTASEDILEQVREKLEEFKAFGIRAEVYNPLLLPVELKVRLIFDKRVTDLDRKMIRAQAQQLIKEHIASLSVGNELDPMEIRSKILRLHEGIYDVDMYYFRIDGKPALLVPQKASWNERFVEAPVPDAVFVA